MRNFGKKEKIMFSKEKSNPIKAIRIGKNLSGMACVVRNKPIVIYAGRMSFEMDEVLRAGYSIRVANLFESKDLPGYNKDRKVYMIDMELLDDEANALEGTPGFDGGEDAYIAIDLLVCNSLAEAKRELKDGVVDAA